MGRLAVKRHLRDYRVTAAGHEHYGVLGNLIADALYAVADHGSGCGGKRRGGRLNLWNWVR